MVAISIAMLSGFWNRLMGLFAHGTPAAEAIQSLSVSSPTFVSLTLPEAGTLGELAQQSIKAAKEWFAGIPHEQIQIPKIPGPAIPSIDSDEPGKFNHGLLGDNGDGTFQPIQFSANTPPSVRDIVDMLDNYRNSLGDDSPGLNNYLATLSEDLLELKPTALVPWWLYERITE